MEPIIKTSPLLIAACTICFRITTCLRPNVFNSNGDFILLCYEDCMGKVDSLHKSGFNPVYVFCVYWALQEQKAAIANGHPYKSFAQYYGELKLPPRNPRLEIPCFPDSKRKLLEVPLIESSTVH